MYEAQFTKHFQSFQLLHHKRLKNDTELIRLVVIGFILSLNLDDSNKPAFLSINSQLQPHVFLSIDAEKLIHETIVIDKRQIHYRWQNIFQFRPPAISFNVSGNFEPNPNNCSRFVFNATKILNIESAGCEISLYLLEPKLELTKFKFNMNLLKKCITEKNLKCISMEMKSFLTLLFTYVQAIFDKFPFGPNSVHQIDLVLDSILPHLHTVTPKLRLTKKHGFVYLITISPDQNPIRNLYIFLYMFSHDKSNFVTASGFQCSIGRSGGLFETVENNSIVIHMTKLTISAHQDMCWRPLSKTFRRFFDRIEMTTRTLRVEVGEFFRFFMPATGLNMIEDVFAMILGNILTSSTKSRILVRPGDNDKGTTVDTLRKISFLTRSSDYRQCSVLEIGRKSSGIQQTSKSNPFKTILCSYVRINIDSCQQGNELSRCVETVGRAVVEPASFHFSFQASISAHDASNLTDFYQSLVEASTFGIFKTLVSVVGLRKIMHQSLIGLFTVKWTESSGNLLAVSDKNKNETSVLHVPTKVDRHAKITDLLHQSSDFLLHDENLETFSVLAQLSSETKTGCVDNYVNVVVKNVNYTKQLCNTQCDKRLHITCDLDTQFCNLTLNQLTYLSGPEENRLESALTTDNKIFNDRQSFETGLVYRSTKTEPGMMLEIVNNDDPHLITETTSLLIYLYHLMLSTRREHTLELKSYHTKVQLKPFNNSADLQYRIDTIYSLSFQSCTENWVKHDVGSMIQLETTQSLLLDDKFTTRLPSYNLPKLYRYHNVENYNHTIHVNSSSSSSMGSGGSDAFVVDFTKKRSPPHACLGKGGFDAVFADDKVERNDIMLNFTVDNLHILVNPVPNPNRAHVILDGSIKVITGRRNAPDHIESSCRIFSVDGRGGGHEKLDLIHISKKESCRKLHTIFLSNSTRIVNRAQSGTFWYIVKRATSQHASLMIENSARVKHVIYLPCKLTNLEEYSTFTFDDNLSTMELACQATNVEQETNIVVKFDRNLNNILLNFKDHFYTMIQTPKHKRSSLSVFQKTGLVDSESLQYDSRNSLKRIAKSFNSFIVYRSEGHFTVFTHNGENSAVDLSGTCQREAPKIMTSVRFNPRHTTMVSVNGDFTSIDFDENLGHLFETSQTGGGASILVDNLQDRFLYLNLKRPCWHMKEQSHELEVRVSYDGFLFINLLSAKHNEKLCLILVTQPLLGQIYVALEFTMKIAFTSDRMVKMTPMACRVPLGTSQILLNPESCYREVWFQFVERQILAMDQFRFQENLVLVATCSTQPVTILLVDYFSDIPAFPALTFEGCGRTWRMRRSTK